MWLPQGGALKIENLQFTQYSIIMPQCLNISQQLTIITENERKNFIHSNPLLFIIIIVIIIIIL